MSFNLASISTWNDEISSGLMSETFLKATTINGGLVDVIYGIKGDTYKIAYNKTTMLGNTASCSFVDSGATTIKQATMDICPIQFSESMCLDDLAKYFTSWEAKNEFNTENLPFEQVFFTDKTNAVAKELDKIAWRATKNTSAPYMTGLTGNLLLCDGFLQQAAEQSASTVNVTKTAITSSNGFDVVNKILESVPAEIIGNANLYLSPVDFQAYLQSLVPKNLFNYNTQSTGIEEIEHPGSIGLKVIRTNGLAGVSSGTAIVTDKENIKLGLSSKSDLSFKTWFSNDLQKLMLLVKLRMGTAFVYPELVVVVR
jgi:hypothetical protein